jgi:hypothetical protein
MTNDHIGGCRSTPLCFSAQISRFSQTPLKSPTFGDIEPPIFQGLQGAKIGGSWFLPGAIGFPGVWRLSRGLKSKREPHPGLIPDGALIRRRYHHEKERHHIPNTPAPRPPAKAGGWGGVGVWVWVALAAAFNLYVVFGTN